MHYFPFFFAEYLADSAIVRMTPEQRGCYIHLLCHLWQMGAPDKLPDDDALLARLAGVPLRRWLRIKAEIILALDNTKNSSLFGARVHDELAKAKSRSKRLSEAGKAGSAKRWHGQAIGRPSAENGQAIERPCITITKTTTTNTPPTPPEGGGGGEVGPAGEDLLDEPPARRALRTWIAERRDLLWSRGLEQRLWRIWSHPLGGPDAVDRLVRIAVEAGAADVGAYACAIFSREIARASDGASQTARRGEWVSSW